MTPSVFILQQWLDFIQLKVNLKPEVIEKSYTNCSAIPEDFKNYSAYIVEIKITKVGKHYPFPLIVQHTEDGNLNKDDGIDEQHPVSMFVDNIYLEEGVITGPVKRITEFRKSLNTSSINV